MEASTHKSTKTFLGKKKKKDFLFAEERSGVSLLLSLSHLAPHALHAVLQGGMAVFASERLEAPPASCEICFCHENLKRCRAPTVPNSSFSLLLS